MIAQRRGIQHARWPRPGDRSRSLLARLTARAITGAAVAGAVIAITTLLFGSLSVAHAATNPHGGASTITNTCQLCHIPHGSQGVLLLFPRGSTIDEFCYTCHDGSGSEFNTRADYDRIPEPLSAHPVQSDSMSCADCHTPHLGPAEDNPRSLAAGQSNESTGNAVCGSCHGPGTGLPVGDILTRYAGSPHDTRMPDPVSGTRIRCIGCHQPHSSENIALLAQRVRGASGVTRTVEATTAARPLCEACHDVPQSLWPGPSAFAITPHGTVATSTRAAVTPTFSADATQGSLPERGWPSPTDCGNCHEPHGTGNPDYLRRTGDALCTSCHDAPGVTRPPGYSYRGASAQYDSPHGALTQDRPGGTPTQGCDVCHAVHGGGARSVDDTSPPGLLWRWEGDLCTGSGTGGCHADPANSSGGTDILAALEAGVSSTTRHDILPSDQTATGARLQCSDCHNPHADTVEAAYSDPDTIGATMSVGFAEYAALDGTVYALVGAEHDGVAPVLAPMSVTAAAVGDTMTIGWGTDEAASSWVDWGTTLTYELGSAGATLPMTATHSVELTPVAEAGEYHFRLRSADALGNQLVSADFAFDRAVSLSGAPVLLPLGVVGAGVNGTNVTTSWSPVTVTDGHSPQYFAEVRNPAGTVIHRSGWIAGTSWTTPRLAFGSWSARVWARDPAHINAASVSATETFSVEFFGGLDLRRWLAALSAGPPTEPATSIVVADSDFSADTDLIAVETRSRNRPSASYAPVAGWESAGPLASRPTPVTPGTAVSGGTLGRAAALDDVRWRTGLTAANREWNWQLSQFDVGETADAATELIVRWEGHGEPTTGYGTRLYLWNRVSGSWTDMFVGSAVGTDTLVVTAPATSVGDGFCLRCHDAAPPSGVVLPAGITTIASAWTTAPPSDWHGPRPGDGVAQSTGTLADGYERGDAVACAVCHDPHGTANPYLFPARVNGVVTSGLAGGNAVADVCHGCHTGATTDWHAGCISCHEGLADDPDHSDPGVDLSDTAQCRDCHRHGSETRWGSGGLRGAPGCSRGVSHSGGCHTWATTF